MSSDNLEFKWGKKRSVGGKNRDVQFYASFRFDGVDYKLADCVYMWKDDETEPFVGKIVKIWQDKCRKVKVLWFFKHSEISNLLGDDLPVGENELFVASGEGVGLANVNPLEAIAGKCNVVCISKDDRNSQPTKDDLEAADYVFYRTFDVGQLIVSETIPEKITGIDIKLIFNQREDQQSNVSTRNETELIPSNECCIDRKEYGGRVNPKKTSEDKSNAAQKGNTVKSSHFPDRDVGDEMINRPFKKPKFEKNDNDLKKRIQSGDIPSQNSGGDKEPNIPQKPDADRRRWFKELPWEERMENAHRQGALVLLENLDPSYSSSDVEDIIWHGFNESCTARIVYRASNSSPVSGQAFVVFKTKDVAEKVVTRLEHGCLMLSNGRPLIGSFANLCIPGKETLVGHFGIDKLAVQLSREKKEAVSTSHCSQPNSIEYEFAMDWCLLHERYNLKRSLLQKQHVEDLKKAMVELKTKLN